MATTIAERSRPEPAELVASRGSTTRLVAGTPCARSAWHIAGSQDTAALRLTWLAIQVAAWPRTACAVALEAADRALPPGPSDADRHSANDSDPAAASSTTEASAPATR